MVRLKVENKIATVANFLDTLGLVPSVLVTKEVVDLIYRSWEREFQREDLSKQDKLNAQAFLVKLSKRKRKPKPVLDNMIPINFQPLYEDVHTTYNKDDSEF